MIEFSQAWHHCVGKLLCVFSYLSLTSEMSGVFVDTGWRSHPCAAENCPNFQPAPSNTFQPARFFWGRSHKHSRYTMVSPDWKTWRKPERYWGSRGRKRNTPLDLKRKQAGQEDRTNTHTSRESGLEEPEHDLIRLVASAHWGPLLALHINQSVIFIRWTIIKAQSEEILFNYWDLGREKLSIKQIADTIKKKNPDLLLYCRSKI